MKQKSKLVGLLFLMSLLAACVYQPTPTPVPQIPDDSLITQSPCAPPCWQGLTPGESTWSEATNFLMNNPLVKGNVEKPYDSAKGYHLWWWASETQDPLRANDIDSDKNDHITYISLSPNTNITIGEVIQVYGLPTYVTMGFQYPPPDSLIPGPEGVGFDALYTKYGFRVRWLEETQLTARPFSFCPSVEAILNTVDYYDPQRLDAEWNQVIDYVPPEGALKFEGKDFVTENDGKIELKCVTFK